MNNIIKPTITVGIPAYNEEANIDILIRSVLNQKLNNFKLDKIIVSSDGSSDKTVWKVKRLKTNKVKIITNQDRKGIARGLNQIISMTKTDILVTLDADIVIKDRQFLEKLATPIKEKVADLTSADIAAFKPESYYEKILFAGTSLKKNVFRSFKKGNNLYTCYGLARAYSKRLYKKLKFPVSVGNDMYSYLYCLKNGYVFKSINNTAAWYRLPQNALDHKKQSVRFAYTFGLMYKHFGKKFIQTEANIPLETVAVTTLKSIPFIILNFITIIFFIFLQFYLKTKKDEKATAETWQIAASTKN